MKATVTLDVYKFAVLGSFIDISVTYQYQFWMIQAEISLNPQRQLHDDDVGLMKYAWSSILSTAETSYSHGYYKVVHIVIMHFESDVHCIECGDRESFLFSLLLTQEGMSISAGKVLVDDRPVTKTGTQVSAKSIVKINAETPKYVCRAGLKLEAALNRFDVEVSGKRALDSGLSTGGFTDCLLQNGAKEVIGVDVGYGQVAEKIRKDSRVKVMERTNVRHLKLADLPGEEPVELVTLDLSFISGKGTCMMQFHSKQNFLVQNM